MTNDLPDALIEKVASSMQKKLQYHLPYTHESKLWEYSVEIAEAALQALDLSGILSDLRFYGDDTEQGQRARTRLEQLLQEQKP